jgi:hypothetical protein
MRLTADGLRQDETGYDIKVQCTIQVICKAMKRHGRYCGQRLGLTIYGPPIAVERRYPCGAKEHSGSAFEAVLMVDRAGNRSAGFDSAGGCADAVALLGSWWGGRTGGGTRVLHLSRQPPTTGGASWSGTDTERRLGLGGSRRPRAWSMSSSDWCSVAHTPRVAHAAHQEARRSNWTGSLGWLGRGWGDVEADVMNRFDRLIRTGKPGDCTIRTSNGIGASMKPSVYD